MSPREPRARREAGPPGRTAARQVPRVISSSFRQAYGPSLLPVGGWMSASSIVLPAITLAGPYIAYTARLMRTSMLEGLNADYLRTARAKGVSERRVIFRHAFRNALIPLTTLTAIDIGALAGGLIITETVFTYPGMGLYFINALKNADYPQFLPWSMIVILFVVVFNLLADISYAWLDPRIRLD